MPQATVGNSTTTDPVDMRDQEIIIACDRLTELAKQYGAICNVNHDDATEDVLLAPLIAERDELEQRIYSMGNPTTPEGMRAMARAALAEASRDSEGNIITNDLREWLVYGVAETVTGEA